MFTWQEVFVQRLRSLDCPGILGTMECLDTDERLLTRVYTATHVYTISCTQMYLGCTVQTRAPRPGEQHTRGNDLPDGPNTYDTWVRILTGIVAYELIPLHIEPVQPMLPIAWPEGVYFPFNDLPADLPDGTYTDNPIDLQSGDEVNSNERN